MAKQGIIIDAPIPGMNQAWGGTNNSSESISILGTEIPPGKSWAMDFARVEDFIKSQLGIKAGSMCWSPTPNGANHYELWGFKDADAQSQFLTEYSNVSGIEADMDHDIFALRLFVTDLPIAATDADTYSVSLSTSRTGSSPANPIVVERGKDFNVPLRVFAWHYPPSGGSGDAAVHTVQPYIIIERYSGSRWESMGSVAVAGIASSENDNAFPNVINVGAYADTGSDGIVQLGFRIPEYTFENAAGETVTMSSNRVTIYLQTVTLGIELQEGQWLKSPVGGGNTISVGFNLQGLVGKTLHVNFLRVDGNPGYSAVRDDVTATGSYNYSITDESGTHGVTQSGVHTLEAWLTYGSGDDMLETPHIIHQILVRQSAQDTAAAVTRPCVLVQQMSETVDNFVQSSLCHYIVWNPKLEDGSYINDTTRRVPVRFVVADGPSLTDPEHVEYVTLPVSVTPGEVNELLATMEVETDVAQESYSARLHALSSDGSAMLTPAVRFSIDNSAGFQPTSGSTFHVNPKSRNNSESSPQTVINARTGETVSSVWENFKMDDSDGYTTDGKGEKVLLVPAGRLLTIRHNPLRYLHDEPSSTKGLTMIFDLTTSNITNEDDPILRLCESAGNGHYLGLRLRPLVGTMGSVTDSDESTTDFRWSEDRRMHLAVTIIPNVRPNVNGDARYHSGMMEANFDPNGTINLVRVYMNGVIVREMEYNASRVNATTGKGVEFFTGDETANPGIVIGQVGDVNAGRASGADIYIYGIRVWERGLTPQEVLQNYVSSLPSSDEKRRIKAQNDILRDDNSGRISLPKACEIGKNCLIWHGVEPMFKDDKKKGWLEIRRYGYDCAYLPQYSGSFCKTTKKLSGKGQGTTAMTYCYWNIQWKYGDVGYNDDGQMDSSGCIVVGPEQVNSNIHLGTPVSMESLDAKTLATFALIDTQTYTHACPVYGGNLGKDEPVGTTPKYYPCTVDAMGAVATIMFPDGWINGSGDLVSSQNPRGGKYCGPCWQADDGLPYGSKNVLKINYASSMQSHLIGINWLYNALHTAYCGPNSLQSDTPSAVVAKQVVPVLFFTAGVNDTSENVTNGTASFRGLGGYGPGKMDKPAWGYSKSAPKVSGSRPDGHDYFAMYEGAVNNTILGDMLAPFDDTDLFDGNGNIIQRAKVKYFLHDPDNPEAKDPESFYYRRTSDEVDGNGQRADRWMKCIGFDGGKTGRTVIENPSTDADLFNNLLCNQNSCDVAGEAPSAKITKVLRDAWNYVYLHNPNVRFYNGTQEQLNSASLTEIQRKRKYITKDSWLLKRWDFCEHRWVDAGLWNTSTHSYDQINIFEVIGSPQNISDDRQAVVDAYIAHIVAEARPTNNDETDGIGAYFKAKSLRFHYAFQNHFVAGTDNCSKNTYYVIDPVTHLIELHQDDVDTTLATDNYGFQTKPYYVDRMNPYDDNDTVRAEDISCYDGMQNGLFDLVEAMWANGNDTLANALNGILNRMSSLNGGIGSAESDSMTGVWRALNRYLFDIQRYFPQSTYNETARIRYEFPAMTGFVGRNGEAPCLQQSMGDQLEAEIQFMRRRLIYMASYAGYGDFAPTEGTSAGTTGLSDAGAQLAVGGDSPDQTFTLTPHQYIFPVFVNGQTQRRTFHRCAPGVAWTYNPGFSDYMNTIALKGLNYFRSVGNLGDKTVNASSFTISGTRLTEFIAEPTNTSSPAFSLGAAPKIGTATRLRRLSLKGCSSTSSTGTVPFDLSKLTLAEEIDLRGTGMQSVTVPQTSTLETLRLPASMASVVLENHPGLSTLEIEGYTNLLQFVVTGSPLLSSDTRSHVDRMILAHVAATDVRISNIDWQAQHIITRNTVLWLLDVGDRGVCQLSGRIEMDSSANGRLLYDDVARLIRRYGNIYDSTISITDSRLYVKFATIGVVKTNMSITGKKYINPSELTNATMLNGSVVSGDFEDLDLSVSGTGNNPAAVQGGDGRWTPDVRWSVVTAGMSSYVVLKSEEENAQGQGLGYSYSPVLHVVQVSHVTLVVRATLTTVTGEERYVEKTIGLWRRIPEVGDFAWTDGEFDCENDASKTLAGMVVMRQMFTAENQQTTDQSQCAYYKIWVLGHTGGTISSPASVTMPTSSDGKSSQVGGTSTQCWGMYPKNTSVSEMYWMDDTKNNSKYVVELLQAISDATGRSDIFDTPLPNRSGDVTLRKDASAVAAAGGGFAMQDANSLSLDGWAAIPSGSTYTHLSDFNTESENATLLNYADVILRACCDYLGITDESLPANCHDEDGNIHPRTPQALSDLTQLIVMYCARAMMCSTFDKTSSSIVHSVGDHVMYKDENGSRSYWTCIAQTTSGTFDSSCWEPFNVSDIDTGSSEFTSIYPGKWRELLFPAVRLCSCWAPTQRDNRTLIADDLCEEYRRGKWMLPSSGLLARIFNFLGNSRASYNGSSAPSEAYANENELEAMLPLFSNAIARGRDFPITYNSILWSVTESGRSYARGVHFSLGLAGSYTTKYGGNVVRPVAAFTFEP